MKKGMCEVQANREAYLEWRGTLDRALSWKNQLEKAQKEYEQAKKDLVVASIKMVEHASVDCGDLATAS